MDKIMVETSARHVHLSREDLDTLFGKGFELSVKKPLSQPGQFQSNERVAVIGEKGQFPSVSILGPIRKQTQVELSATDARSIGVTPPVRESGDLSGSAPCKIVGPKGEIEIKEGVIVAKRHIHMTPEDAANYGVENGKIVSLRVESKERSLIFEDVVIRVSDRFALACHIDTDESNACGGGKEGELILS